MAKAQATQQAAKEPGLISPLKLNEILKGFAGIDSVELKLTVDSADRRSTAKALDMDPLNAQIRQVIFFDTPDLVLNRSGVVVRSRRIQGKQADSVIKLRPIVPAEISQQLKASPAFSIELDLMRDGFVCSGSMKNVSIDDAKVKDVLAGRVPIRKLFTKEQKALYAVHAPKGLELDQLSILGPISILKLKFSPTGLNQKLVAELWFYPDGSQILELSTKALPGKAEQVAREARAFLEHRGVKPGTGQSTKTKTALAYYSKELSS